MTKKIVISALLFLTIIGIFIFIKNNANLSQQKLSKYQHFLAKLPLDNPNSIIKGKEAYFKYFSLEDPIKQRDYAFKYFLNFYTSVINKINENLSTNDTLNEGNITEESQTKKINYYESCGIKIFVNEGLLYPDIDYTFLHHEFDKYISPAWKDYLYFLVKESGEGFMDDAAIIIPWDKMRERIIILESFMNNYPKFANKDEAQNKIKKYLYFYLVGTDNSPIYINSEENGKTFLKSEVKKSYEQFIDTDKDSKYNPIILEYYNLLKKHNFKVGNYIHEFVKQKGLDIFNTPE